MRKALVASIVAFGMAFSAPAFAGGSHHGGGGTKIGAGLGAKLGVGVNGHAVNAASTASAPRAPMPELRRRLIPSMRTKNEIHGLQKVTF